MYWYEKILNNKPENPIKDSVFNVNYSFRWIESRTLNRSYQLIHNNRTIGSLIFLNKSTSKAAGNIFGREFIIKRRRFLSSFISIEQRYGLKKHKLLITDFNGRGLLKLSKDETIIWKCNKLLENEWSFSSNKKRIMVFKPITTFYKSGCFAEIRNNNLNEYFASVFLLLGIFILANTDEEIGITSAFI